jgi:Protein of unknown function (DUF3997)
MQQLRRSTFGMRVWKLMGCAYSPERGVNEINIFQQGRHAMQSMSRFWITYSLAIFLSCSIPACSSAAKRHIVDKFYLLGPNDQSETMGLCYETSNGYDEVVPGDVFAVSYDDHYIIAKQHPLYIPKPGDPQDTLDFEPQRNITNYYIVPRHQADPPRITVMGPLTLEEFTTRQTELSVQATFSK